MTDNDTSNDDEEDAPEVPEAVTDGIEGSVEGRTVGPDEMGEVIREWISAYDDEDKHEHDGN